MGVMATPTTLTAWLTALPASAHYRAPRLDKSTSDARRPPVGSTGTVGQAPGAVRPRSRGAGRHGKIEVVTELTDEVRAERESELRSLVDLMRPAVQADGGDLELVSFDVDAGQVEVQLRGACSSCAISSATLQGGVDRILRSRLPWVTEVTGGVDEDVDMSESAALGRGGYVPRLP